MAVFEGVLSIVLLLILGILMMLKPELLWEIEHFFTVKNGEPTDLYLALMRIGGAIFTVVAVCVALIFMFR